MKPRKPKNLDQYSEATVAAKGLEQLAADIRAAAAIRPFVRWHISLSFWNPAWELGPRGQLFRVGLRGQNQSQP